MLKLQIKPPLHIHLVICSAVLTDKLSTKHRTLLFYFLWVGKLIFEYLYIKQKYLRIWN